MKSANSIWRFVNQTNTSEIIVVHDAESAQNLKLLLQKSGGKWMMREEKVESSSVPPPKGGVEKAAPAAVVKKMPADERRKQRRFMTEFKVILISGSNSFRTISQDVSLGGMKLKKSVPISFLSSQCIAYISHKDLSENIELVCNVIADPDDPCRIQFMNPNPVQMKRLNEWLVEHTAKAAAMKSSMQ